MFRLHRFTRVTVFHLVACFALAGAAWSQGRIQRIAEDVLPTYILSAASWGAAQDQAVADAHGTVLFRHAATGIGIAQSADPGFYDRVLKTGLFEDAGTDQALDFGGGPAAGTFDGAATGDAAEPFTIDAATPGDETYIRTQWALDAIEAPGAWALGFEGDGIRVAVLDGGMCSTQQDIFPNLDIGASRSFVPGLDFDVDAIGFRRACHIAGIIAAADNGRGTIGVAPRATLIACKVADRGVATFESIISAILYAADPVSAGGGGADVIVVGPSALIEKTGGKNGTKPLLKALKKAVEYAADRDVPVIAAAGDEGMDLDHSGKVLSVLAESGKAIGVAATGPTGFAAGYPSGATNFSRPAVYTNYGSSAIFLAAPGGDNVYDAGAYCSMPRVPAGSFNLPCYVFDMVVAPGYTNGSTSIWTWSAGTSVAAAHVAGVAALVKQASPGIDVGHLRDRLSHTAISVPGMKDYHGKGFVNARRAVAGIDDEAAQGITPATDFGPARSGLSLAMTPQPLRRSGSFVLSLPRAGHARLELFDIAGRSVAVLHDGMLPAGRATVVWNGQARGGNLASGTYFARLVVDGERTARRLVVIEP